MDSTIGCMTASDPALCVVPANEVSWEDLQTVFGTGGPAWRCQCQRYKLRPLESFGAFPVEERAHRLREQTDCGRPGADATSGLVAFLDGEPVGWCAVEPRSSYIGLVRNNRVPWTGREEDRSDVSVWAAEELHVGTVGVFADAGLTEVSRPTQRRVVMRVDLA